MKDEEIKDPPPFFFSYFACIAGFMLPFLAETRAMNHVGLGFGYPSPYRTELLILFSVLLPDSYVAVIMEYSQAEELWKQAELEGVRFPVFQPALAIGSLLFQVAAKASL